MSFLATITIPSTPTLVRILSTEEKANARATTTILSQNGIITININASDFTSLRASTNTVMQTIAVHNNITEA